MDTRRPALLRQIVLFLFSIYGMVLSFYLLLRLLLRDGLSGLALLHSAAPYYFLPIVVGLFLLLFLRARRVLAFYVLLALIGFLWIGVRLIPRPAAPAEASASLKLITFNIFPDNRTDDAAVEWLLQQEADIILLQETSRRLDLSELSDEYDFQALSNIENGSAIYSRIRFVESAEFDLAGFRQQRVVMNIGGEQVALYNIHLSMPFDAEADEDSPLLARYDETRRNQQIDELLNLLEDEDLPVIVAGDFKLSEFSLKYDDIARHFTDGFRRAGWGLGFTWPGGASEETNTGLPLLARLDYVWYGEDIQARSAAVGPPLGSDHLPLLMTLDILP